jgi:hypothetical protein
VWAELHRVGDVTRDYVDALVRHHALIDQRVSVTVLDAPRLQAISYCMTVSVLRWRRYCHRLGTVPGVDAPKATSSAAGRAVMPTEMVTVGCSTTDRSTNIQSRSNRLTSASMLSRFINNLCLPRSTPICGEAYG